MQRAAGLATGSTLVLGDPQTGRTTYVINQLNGKKVLWIAMNNTGTVSESDAFADGSQLVVVNDLKTDIPVVSKEQGFDAIVLDGFNQFIGLWFTANLGDTKPFQDDWGKVSQAAKKLILDLRKVAPVYCIVDLEKDEAGLTQIALNRATAQGITGLFDRKVRTIVKREMKLDAKTQSKSFTTSYSVLTGIDALTF